MNREIWHFFCFLIHMLIIKDIKTSNYTGYIFLNCCYVEKYIVKKNKYYALEHFILNYNGK